jgi:hypothetical protein
MNGDDVRMVQRRGRARFPLESLDAIVILRQLGTQRLEGNPTLQLRVFGQINLPHSSFSKEFEKAVMSEYGSDHV